MRLRRAKSISTFLRSFSETSYCFVLAPLVPANMHEMAVDAAGNLTGVFRVFAGNFARCCPLAGRVGVGRELGLAGGGRAKGCTIQNLQIFPNCAWRIVRIDG